MTTTFRFWSDLHLEVGSWRREWFEGGADQYLILAGDVCEMRHIARHYDFFEMCSISFKHVFYVPGNHEFWSKYLEKVPAIKQYLAETFHNVTMLSQNAIHLDCGVSILGATLWYDASHLDSSAPRQYLRQVANDYKYISTKRRGWSGLRPSDVIYHNVRDILWLKQASQLCAGKVVIVTHHAPHVGSVDHSQDPESYREYVNDLNLDEFKCDVWVHGHVHKMCDYYVGDTHVLCNPRGYELYNHVNPTFDPHKTFTVTPNEH